MTFSTIAKLAATAPLVFVIAACQQSPDKKIDEAVQAQQQADNAVAVQKQKAEDKIVREEERASDHIDSIEKNTDNKVGSIISDAQQKIYEAQAKADKKADEARNALGEAKTAFRVQHEKALDDLAKRTSAVQTKIDKSASAAKADGETAIRALQLQINGTRTELRDLTGSATTDLSGIQAKVDGEVDSIKKRVEELDKKF